MEQWEPMFRRLPPRRKAQRLVFRHAQTTHCQIGIVGCANSIDSVAGFQFSGSHQRRLVVACHNRSIDGAFDLIALNGESDFLSHWLSWSYRFMHGRVLTSPPVHLKRRWTESAHDKRAIAIGRTIK